MADEKKSTLSFDRRVPAFNSVELEWAVNELRAPDTFTAEKRNQALIAAFKEHEVEVARGQADVRDIPSRIKQMVANRIRAQLLVRLWAMEMGDVNAGDWGEQLSYRFHNNALPRVYSIGAPGGGSVELTVNNDQVVNLAEPTFYTTDEFLVPRFDPRFPGRYRQDLEEIAEFASIAIANQIDTDCMTAVNAQVVLAASGDLLSSGMTFVHPKVYGAPTYNALDYATEQAVNMVVWRNLGLHAMKLGRRIERIYMHPDTIDTIWQQIDAGAGSTYYAQWPETYRSRIADTGEQAYTNMFGMEFPLPTPTMAIDVSGAEKYFWALLSPSDPVEPKGVFWLFTYPSGKRLGANGEAYFVDNIQYVDTRVENARIYDLFLLQKAVNIVYCNYQRPNLVRVRYD
jgi:hypothetical protein